MNLENIMLSEKKLGIEGHISYESLYVKTRTGKSIEAEIQSIVARDSGEGRTRVMDGWRFPFVMLKISWN